MHDENIMDAKKPCPSYPTLLEGNEMKEVLMMNPLTGEVERLSEEG